MVLRKEQNRKQSNVNYTAELLTFFLVLNKELWHSNIAFDSGSGDDLPFGISFMVISNATFEIFRLNASNKI
jgi:hypothetical protein